MVLEKQLNRTLPDGVTVQSLVETENTVYVVVPHVPEGELTDSDLEQVAGGLFDKEENCNEASGVGNTWTIIAL